jgi:hypothetical protein
MSSNGSVASRSSRAVGARAGLSASRAPHSNGVSPTKSPLHGASTVDLPAHLRHAMLKMDCDSLDLQLQEEVKLLVDTRLAPAAARLI